MIYECENGISTKVLREALGNFYISDSALGVWDCGDSGESNEKN